MYKTSIKIGHPSGWKLPDYQQDIPIDMSGGKHLFIRTNTEYGVDKSIYIKFSDRSDRITEHQIYFKNWEHNMYYCGNYQLENVPDAVEKLWMIEKADTYSAIWCNGVELLKVNFAEANNDHMYCEGSLTNKVPTKIKFRGHSGPDTASIEYQVNLGFDGKLSLTSSLPLHCILHQIYRVSLSILLYGIVLLSL